MEVARRAGEFDFDVRQPAQAVRDRRHAGREERGVAHEHDVGGQQVFVLLDERREVDAPALLLALDHHLEVDRQRSPALEVRFDRLDVHERLPLVVGRAARDDVAVFDDGLERRALPQVERVGRLHVVVAVDEDRRGVVGDVVLGVDDGVAARLHHVHLLHADAAEVGGEPLGGAARVVVVVGVGGDRGDAEPVGELVDERVGVGLGVLDGVGHGGAG